MLSGKLRVYWLRLHCGKNCILSDLKFDLHQLSINVNNPMYYSLYEYVHLYCYVNEYKKMPIIAS